MRVLGLLACLLCSASLATAQSSPPRARFPLAGSVWIVEEIDGRPVQVFGGLPPRLTFGARGLAELRACNRYGISVDSAGASSLRFRTLTSTLLTCGKGDAEDRALEQALLATTTYVTEGGFLELGDDHGQRRLRARRADQP